MKGTGNESNSDAFLKDRGKTVVTNHVETNPDLASVMINLKLCLGIFSYKTPVRDVSQGPKHPFSNEQSFKAILVRSL